MAEILAALRLYTFIGFGIFVVMAVRRFFRFLGGKPFMNKTDTEVDDLPFWIRMFLVLAVGVLTWPAIIYVLVTTPQKKA
jgi:hypothetical protein